MRLRGFATNGHEKCRLSQSLIQPYPHDGLIEEWSGDIDAPIQMDVEEFILVSHD
jgi:hypothetical protein